MSKTNTQKIEEIYKQIVETDFKDDTAVRYLLKKMASRLFVEGPRGKRGHDGIQGPPGFNGRDGTSEARVREIVREEILKEKANPTVVKETTDE